MDEEREAASLKDKMRTSRCFSCCFRGARGGGGTLSSSTAENDDRPRLIRASSTWLRSRAQDLPEIRDKCRNLISRIGRSRRQSRDFRYDPLSYALNFDGGIEESGVDEIPLRNFSTRLPSSPPPRPSAEVPSGEVAAF